MNSGIINVYKEAGYTSFDVVARLRGILKVKKIGHTGTLDPDAEGVLPVCIGKATKLCDMLTDKDKVYRCVMLLGVDTDTYDISGKVLNESQVCCSEDELLETIQKYVGNIMQVPPMYSALKHNGKKLYELARAGIEIDRPARPVTIYSINVADISFPEVTMEIHCSKGTYIRSLCHDIGQDLGCGATMKSLLRTKVSIFELSDARKLDEIEKIVKNGKLDSIMMPIDQAFDNLSSLFVIPDEDAIMHAINGAPINYMRVFSEVISSYEQDQSYKLYLPDNRFLGIYKYTDEYFILEKMFLEQN